MKKSNINEALIKIYGSVQGVNFRYSALMQAQKLSLVGWTENVSDGSVAILAQGTKENLKKLIDWAKKGPPLAKVEKVQVSWNNAQVQTLPSFEIR